jgi:hypothetical protein
MNNRSRKLLDLAHKVGQCQNCGCWCGEGCEPAHENGINAGKGFGIKGQDNRHAALCHRCHAWYDSGGNEKDPSGRFEPTREGKAEMWNAAHKKTFDIYWKESWLKVAV